jgi:hypothetical protein
MRTPWSSLPEITFPAPAAVPPSWRARNDPKRARGRVYGTLLGIGVAAGAVAGSIITLLLSR